MIVYAESSAVLSWLLGEVAGEGVRQVLAAADHVISSDLTLVESDRVLHRAAREGHLDMADATSRRTRLARVVAGWTMLRIGSGIVQRGEAAVSLGADPVARRDPPRVRVVRA